ncbi:MAG: exo-alpha-sialidase, partial [Planctomycetaceae bacterium]|nr:exo-alpha-sialidase [Planctomycetaceae bacterium]
MKNTILSFFVSIVFITVTVLADESLPPGVIISKSPDFATTYVGSPSITILPDGTYVASHDWFGKSPLGNLTQIFVSKDKGTTWNQTAQFPFHWANLFVHKGDLYLLGVIK